MPNEPGDSWFSPKCIEVQPRVMTFAGRALDGLGGEKLTKLNQTANGEGFSSGVSQWGISSIGKRETAQIIS